MRVSGLNVRLEYYLELLEESTPLARPNICERDGFRHMILAGLSKMMHQIYMHFLYMTLQDFLLSF